jgi:hypothetical protein
MDSFRLISRTLFYRGVQTFFFYVVVTSVDLTKENDETVGAFLRCVFASTLDIITLPKHMRGNTLYLLQQKYLMNMFIL